MTQRTLGAVRRLLLIASLAATAAAAPRDGGHPAAARPRVMLVKPVVLCDDDGSHPARSAFPKSLVDRVYTRAGLETLYLDPVRWSFGAGRRGETNLNAVVTLGRAQGMIAADPRVLTLLFVTCVDGQPGPLGRGMQNGNVCFVSLGPEGKMTNEFERAFVVAHEIGHCLNLRHAADDSAVPDKSANLQGDGPFESRLAAESLHPSQCATVLKSPLAVERVVFHDGAEAARLLSDEAWEPYLSGATDDMLRFTLGCKADAAVPLEKSAREAMAFEGCRAMAQDFSEDEKAGLRRQVERLAELTGNDWPLVSRLPWHFIKAKEPFCSGFPHTRGLAIVMQPRMLDFILHNEPAALTILLHEKLHVVQRLYPDRMSGLAKQYGFVPVRLAEGEVARLNIVQNPDDLRPGWALELGGQASLIAAVFDRKPDGSLVFAEKRYRLERGADGASRGAEELASDDLYRRWRARFPIPHGHESPLEISAYVSGVLLAEDYLGARGASLGESQRKISEATKSAFAQILQLPRLCE